MVEYAIDELNGQTRASSWQYRFVPADLVAAPDRALAEGALRLIITAVREKLLTDVAVTRDPHADIGGSAISAASRLS